VALQGVDRNGSDSNASPADPKPHDRSITHANGGWDDTHCKAECISGTGDPEGAAHGCAAFFDKTKDVLSKNPGHAADGRFELDLSVFFGHFLFKKKVTRAPARKRFRAFPEACDQNCRAEPLKAIPPWASPGTPRLNDQLRC
jgi:hypothetical protein